MKTAEDISVQLSYRIVEFCEHALSRNQRENQVAELIQNEMESFAKERAVEFELSIGPVEYKDEKTRRELVELWYDKFTNNK